MAIAPELIGSSIPITNLEDIYCTSFFPYRYDAFGKTISETGTTNNKYLFAGEQFDQGLGDYYLRQRYYDISTGRFTRRDDYEGRLGEPLTSHKYIYAHNNPITFTDPSGYFSILEVGARVAIIGILAGLGAAFPSSPIDVGTVSRLEVRFTRITALPFNLGNILPIDHAVLVLADKNGRTSYEAGPEITLDQNRDPNANRGALVSKFPGGKKFTSLQNEDMARMRTLPVNKPIEAIKHQVKTTMEWINTQRFAYNAIPGKLYVNSNSAVSQALTDLGFSRESLLWTHEQIFSPGWVTDLRGWQTSIRRAGSR